MDTNKHRSQIQGWGADLDLANRPAVPKERTPPRYTFAHWSEPEPQPQKIVVFKSIERPDMTPVFGTSAPPRGLSGLVRKLAYKMSENDIRRWLTLVAADRIDVFEGIVEDVARGHIPNLYKELGLGADLKHNRKGFIIKVAVMATTAGLTIYLLNRRAKRKQQPELVPAKTRKLRLKARSSGKMEAVPSPS